MNLGKTGAGVLALLLALLLLAGCGTAAPQAEPEETAEPEAPAVTDEPVPDEAVRVSTVDEFLDAIAPDTTVVLTAGYYEISTASNYGKPSNSGCYSWIKVFDGYILEIHNVDGLRIVGEGAERTKLLTDPRYANVLQFVSCQDLTIEDLTAGHVQEPGFCSGGVLSFENCGGCTVRRCGLFGCGTVGVWAENCADLRIEDTTVYECSSYAYQFSLCRGVRVTGGEVRDCGKSTTGSPADVLFSVQRCSGVFFSGLRVHDNYAYQMLRSSLSLGIVFLSDRVTDNHFSTVLNLDLNAPLVDGCLFDGNEALSWYLYPEGVKAVDLEGRELTGDDLSVMELREIDPDSVPQELFAPAETLELEPGAEVTVRTVDEFLAAIGPDRTIVLEGGLFDLSAARAYGSVGSLYYYWQQSYDGPELVIDGAAGLTIRAASEDPKATTITAVPRYANVLCFKNCDGLTLSGFTAGHTAEPGACSGGVLYFESCTGVTVDACRLYGCGILGIQAYLCSDISVLDSEIFDCSVGAVETSHCEGIRFSGCEVHNVPSPALSFSFTVQKYWDGEELPGICYDITDGKPMELWASVG